MKWYHFKSWCNPTHIICLNIEIYYKLFDFISCVRYPFDAMN